MIPTHTEGAHFHFDVADKESKNVTVWLPRRLFSELLENGDCQSSGNKDSSKRKLGDSAAAFSHDPSMCCSM